MQFRFQRFVTGDQIRILLLSAYDVASHRYWRQTLTNYLTCIDWQQLCLPARHFNWRIRGNALSWALTEQQCLSEHYDVLIATSMVDLACLKGLVPNLAKTPSILYFHENQFAYPLGSSQQYRIEPQMVTLYAGLAANRLVFNSQYNQSTYLAGIKLLLAKMPDRVPKGIVRQLASKSQVIPVPIEHQEPCKHQLFSKPITLVWNHRWEYDKGPDRLLALLATLELRHLDYKIHIIGQQFRKQPEAFVHIKNRFSAHIGEFGYLKSKTEYQRVLSESDLVLSTAIHEFQGLAVMEAVAHGCIPVIPDRLSYPEFFDKKYCYPSELGDPSAEASGMCDKIEYWLRYLERGQQPEIPDLSALSWQNLGESYGSLIFNLIPD